MCCLNPTVDELSPNAAGEAGVWKTVVKRIVAESKDLTVLRNVGADRRRKANQAGLFAWTDPAVTAESVGVTGKTAAPLLDALLDVNRTAGELVRPDCVAASRWEWINTPPLEFYVDFETVSDINDDFCALPNRGGQPLVFMVGCGHVENGEWQFECFVADQLTETAEADIIDQWHDHMNTVTARLDPAGTPKVIHWSGHEVSSLTAAAKRHGAASQHPELNWFDFLNKVIKAEPVVVNGSHGFGLKDITKAMHRHGLVDTNWQNGPADGLGAMVGAWWCQSEVDNSRAVNLMDLDLMHEIRDYNEVDCKAMLNIVDYLREHH